MVALFASLWAIAILLVLPGWLWFRRNRHQSLWLFMLPAFGTGLWLVLVVAGVGAQSLSNLIETFVIAALAVVMAYAKFLAFDRMPTLQGRGTLIAFAVVALATVGLRLFMPVLPE